MMRGVFGRRLGNPLTTLIASRVNWSRQHCSARPWLDEEHQSEIDESGKRDREAIRKRMRNCPVYLDSIPDIVFTREERDQLYRIANTVPESAPGLVKRYAKYMAYTLLRTNGCEFEEKIRKMHEVVEEVSRGYK